MCSEAVDNDRAGDLDLELSLDDDLERELDRDRDRDRERLERPVSRPSSAGLLLRPVDFSCVKQKGKSLKMSFNLVNTQ